MNFYESVGHNILNILEEQNKTQSALAEDIGISRQVMLKITKGTKAINALEISKIARVLNVSIERITQPIDEKEDSFVMFMGGIKNDYVKDRFDFLNHIIDEIVHLEEDLNES